MSFELVQNQVLDVVADALEALNRRVSGVESTLSRTQSHNLGNLNSRIESAESGFRGSLASQAEVLGDRITGLEAALAQHQRDTTSVVNAVASIGQSVQAIGRKVDDMWARDDGLTSILERVQAVHDAQPADPVVFEGPPAPEVVVIDIPLSEEVVEIEVIDAEVEEEIAAVEEELAAGIVEIEMIDAILPHGDPLPEAEIEDARASLEFILAEGAPLPPDSGAAVDAHSAVAGIAAEFPDHDVLELPGGRYGIVEPLPVLDPDETVVRASEVVPAEGGGFTVRPSDFYPVEDVTFAAVTPTG